MDQCPLCNQIVKKDPIDFDIYIINCKICGKYKVTNFILTHAIDTHKFKKYILSGITRQFSEDGQCITIDDENLQQIVDSFSIPDSPFEKMDRILLYIQKKASNAGSYVTINPDFDYPIAFAKKKDEMDYYIEILSSKLNLIEYYPSPITIID